MGEVVIAGIGQIPVGEHWNSGLRNMATKAIRAALSDAGNITPNALYVGNLLAPVASRQSNLGSLFAENSGLEGIESFSVEAAGASGAAALRLGCIAIASGFIDAAVVVGAEKCTDVPDNQLEAFIAETMDYDFESMQGLTLTAQAAIIMQRYLYEYKLPPDSLAHFPLIAHHNAVNNPNAMFRKNITLEHYQKAAPISNPINLFDVAPYADGAAAVVLARPDILPDGLAHKPIKIIGSSIAIDTLSPHDRNNPLTFEAVSVSTQQACRQAGITPHDVDFIELCDSFSIYAALSLEAAGFAQRGQSTKLAQEGKLNLDGELPINTMGGCKGRGNPLGATGIYQITEAVQQLRGQAGQNQIVNARRAMVQTLGGPASTVVTHILEN